jgi:hypothetical protein
MDNFLKSRTKLLLGNQLRITRLKIMGRQDLLAGLQQKKKLNDYRKIKLKDFYSIDKDKGKEVGYDIGLLLEYNPVQLS